MELHVILFISAAIVVFLTVIGCIAYLLWRSKKPHAPTVLPDLPRYAAQDREMVLGHRRSAASAVKLWEEFWKHAPKDLQVILAYNTARAYHNVCDELNDDGNWRFLVPAWQLHKLQEIHDLPKGYSLRVHRCADLTERNAEEVDVVFTDGEAALMFTLIYTGAGKYPRATPPTEHGFTDTSKDTPEQHAAMLKGGMFVEGKLTNANFKGARVWTYPASAVDAFNRDEHWRPPATD